MQNRSIHTCCLLVAILAMVTTHSRASQANNLYQNYLKAIEAETLKLAEDGFTKNELTALTMKVTHQPEGTGETGYLPFVQMLQRVAVALHSKGFARNELTVLSVLSSAAPRAAQSAPSESQQYTGFLDTLITVARELNDRGFTKQDVAAIKLIAAQTPPLRFERADYGICYTFWSDQLSAINERLRVGGYSATEQVIQNVILALQPRLVQNLPKRSIEEQSSEDEGPPPLPRPPDPKPPVQPDVPPPASVNSTPTSPPFHQPNVLPRPATFRVCGQSFDVTIKYQRGSKRTTRAPSFLLQLVTGDVIEIDTGLCRSRFLTDEVKQVYIIPETRRTVLVRRNGDAVVVTHNELYRFARNVTAIEPAPDESPPRTFTIRTGKKRTKTMHFAQKPGPKGLKTYANRRALTAQRLYRLVWGSL
jgi:hypothetical protein